VGLTGCGVDR